MAFIKNDLKLEIRKTKSYGNGKMFLIALTLKGLEGERGDQFDPPPVVFSTLRFQTFTNLWICAHFAFLHLILCTLVTLVRGFLRVHKRTKQRCHLPIHTNRHTHIHTQICHVEFFEEKLRQILSSSRRSFIFRTIFRFFYLLTTRKTCVSDYSYVVEERFFALTRIWSNVRILEKIILIRGQHGFGDKGKVLIGINDMITCLNIWLVCISDWQVMANFKNSWSSWKFQLLGLRTLF